MTFVVTVERRRRNVVTAAPELYLRLAVLLHGLRLVETLQGTVAAFIEAPRTLDRHPHSVHLVEHNPKRADGALQHRRERDIYQSLSRSSCRPAAAASL